MTDLQKNQALHNFKNNQDERFDVFFFHQEPEERPPLSSGTRLRAAPRVRNSAAPEGENVPGKWTRSTATLPPHPLPPSVPRHQVHPCCQLVHSDASLFDSGPTCPTRHTLTPTQSSRPRHSEHLQTDQEAGLSWDDQEAILRDLEPLAWEEVARWRSNSIRDQNPRVSQHRLPQSLSPSPPLPRPLAHPPLFLLKAKQRQD